MTRVGWIGAGIMGKAMGRNLMKHGFALHLSAADTNRDSRP